MEFNKTAWFCTTWSQQESTPERRDHSWEQLRLISLWLRKSKWKETFLWGIRSYIPKHFWVECNSQRNVGAKEKCEFKYVNVFSYYLMSAWLLYLTVLDICKKNFKYEIWLINILTKFSSYIFSSFPLHPKFSLIFSFDFLDRILIVHFTEMQIAVVSQKLAKHINTSSLKKCTIIVYEHWSELSFRN